MYPVYSSGVITARDEFVISESVDELIQNGKYPSGNPKLDDKTVCLKLGIAEKKGWDIDQARKRLRKVKDLSKIIHDISYRPFDNRKILFDESVVWTTARSTMDHMLKGNKLALISARSEKSGTCSHFFVSRFLVETKCGERTTQSAVFPLYFYTAKGDLVESRQTNIDPKLYARLQSLATHLTRGKPNEQAVFNYIYGVLHWPTYRRAYAEFLKIDFPRIPWPTSPDQFWSIADNGDLLRGLHLMEPEAIGETPYKFEGQGDSFAHKARVPRREGLDQSESKLCRCAGSLWALLHWGVPTRPEVAEGPKKRPLSFENILHYQRIIKILAETDRIMKTIDRNNEGIVPIKRVRAYRVATAVFLFLAVRSVHGGGSSVRAGEHL